MKKVLVSILAVAAMTSASAATWWYNGVLYGNICRNGAYFTVYPVQYGQPVGSTCPVRNSYGNIISYGEVTNE